MFINRVLGDSKENEDFFKARGPVPGNRSSTARCLAAFAHPIRSVSMEGCLCLLVAPFLFCVVICACSTARCLAAFAHPISSECMQRWLCLLVALFLLCFVVRACEGWIGCEMNQIDWLLDAYGLEQGPLFQTMNIQNVTGLGKTIEIGIRKVKEMLPIANLAYREECPVSELKIALQCGGSDAWSGITANPALGKACDILISHGGTGLLAETPEIYGAEHLLTKRSVNQETGEKLVNLIKWWEDYTLRNKGTMDNNPSPGNKKGGLTTILEKSLGASVKGGNTPLMGVYKYAEIVKEKGFTFMDSPGYDPASVTGQIAGGCNIVCFTTGRGSAFGSKPAPTIKLATNTEMYTRMKDDMDINCGDILDGRLSVEEKGKQIYEMIVRVASGEKSKSELQGLGDYEFVPWQIGAVM